jgi:predicted acyltransferase
MLSGKGTILSTAGNIIGGQFEHAEWEGLHFYDLIFPLFIFVTVDAGVILPRSAV